MPGIREESSNLLVVVAGDTGGVEAVEGLPVVLPLGEDGRPGEPCLSSLEQQHLEEMSVVVGRDAPLVVVVCPHRC